MRNKQFYEFYCNDCDGWIMLSLGPDMMGKEYKVECPSCHRQHPRVFKENGDVIQPTYDYKTVNGVKTVLAIHRGPDEKLEDILIPMPSAYSKKSRLEKLQSTRGFTADLVLAGLLGENLDFEENE